MAKEPWQRQAGTITRNLVRTLRDCRKDIEAAIKLIPGSRSKDTMSQILAEGDLHLARCIRSIEDVAYVMASGPYTPVRSAGQGGLLGALNSGEVSFDSLKYERDGPTMTHWQDSAGNRITIGDVVSFRHHGKDFQGEIIDSGHYNPIVRVGLTAYEVSPRALALKRRGVGKAIPGKARIRPGGRVRVLQGRHAGESGRVTAVMSGGIPEANVELDSGLRRTFRLDDLTTDMEASLGKAAPVGSMRIKPGQPVVIKRGRFAGQPGRVVAVWRRTGDATVRLHRGGQEIFCFDNLDTNVAPQRSLSTGRMSREQARGTAEELLGQYRWRLGHIDRAGRGWAVTSEGVGIGRGVVVSISFQMDDTGEPSSPITIYGFDANGNEMSGTSHSMLSPSRAAKQVR